MQHFAQKKYTFLIGGMDLEMAAIIRLLNEHDLHFINNKLSWGATLSAYEEFFNEEDTFVGIELIKDIPAPKKYIAIDHHNENSQNKTSLEQLVELLKNDFEAEIVPGREMQLISANDKGYIPAMLKIGATEAEITDIRKRDRVEQGVTENDEVLAKQSIQNHLRVEKGIIIVKSLTPRFSPITDNLYPFKKLLIYTAHELTCYGEGILKLAETFTHFSAKSKVYYGGGENGYWGISGDNIDKELIKQIINIFAMEPLSSHIFLFPFKFKSSKKDSEKSKKNSEKSKKDSEKSKKDSKESKKDSEESKNFYINFTSHIKESGWDQIDEKDGDDTLYNEKTYFHEFVHPVLFAEPEPEPKKQKSENSNSQEMLIEKYVREEKEKEIIYQIDVFKKEKEEQKKLVLGSPKVTGHIAPKYKKVTIKLNIKKVTLDLYSEASIGIFAFHLDYFPGSDVKQEDMLDLVLLINQYGRRLYPPFLDLNIPNFGKVTLDGVSIGSLKTKLEGTKFRELADSISIQVPGETPIVEDWAHFNTPKNSIHYIPKHIRYFLNLKGDEKVNEFYIKNYKNDKGKKTKHSSEVGFSLTPILDDRMFVMCWLGSEQLTSKFKQKELKLKDEKKKYGYVLSDLCDRHRGGYEGTGFYRNSAQQRSFAINRDYDGYGYISNDFWYKYLFVDGIGKSCQNELTQKQLLKTHTYDRWVGYNTLYGISRYSFVILTAPLKELKEPDINAAFITDHFRNIYFRMVSLVLAQRAIILDFQKKIGNIKIPQNYEERENQEISHTIYASYRKFINKVFYREVTAQEQGIELYDMLQEHLRVDKQAKELEVEFREMHNLVELTGTNQRNNRMRVLTILGAIFVVPSFIFSLLSNRFFNSLPSMSKFAEYPFSLDSIVLLGIIGFCTGLVIMGVNKWYDKLVWKLWYDKLVWKFRWSTFVFAAIIIFIIYLLFFQLTIGKVF